MPLSNEFRRHLHELMVETTLGLKDELNQHQREVVGKARQTNNAAALPVAYSEAAIHAFRTRVEAVISRYMEALENCGIEVDENVEKGVLQLIGALTSAKHPLSLPPGVKHRANMAGIQRAHIMEMSRVGALLYRKAANLLREAKMKAKKKPAEVITPASMSRPEPFTIASVATTLAEVKALPAAEQDMLLLRQLAQIYPQMSGAGGLHKHNLLMNGDPWGLGTGLPEAEKTPIFRHLFGAPWARLVNAGLISDPAGNGFFVMTDEGLAAVSAAAELRPPAAHAARNPDIPTAFMSYSWDTPAHKNWVLHLAERLRSEGGINVVLDYWHLPIGGDRTFFMENSIRESDFVLLVCTPTYAQKSNTRTGGVGYEATILTGQMAQQITQNKFIPVLRAGEWDDSSIPIWLQTKIGVDFRDDPYSEEQYDLLLRTLHQAQEQAPPVGPKPNFQAPTRIEAGGLVGNAVTTVLESVGVGTGPSQTEANAAATKRPKQSPEAYAFYERKGSDARMQVFVRPVDPSADLYSFETSAGDYEEGSGNQIALRYLRSDLELKQKGYTRMQSFNGTSGQRFNLP
jgi:hypothetical protein